LQFGGEGALGMQDQHKIFLIGGGDDETAIFTLLDGGDDCRLRCEYRGEKIESLAADFFQALCDIRVRLADDRLIPFCYGASVNVFPSGMARSMGQGLKAYKLTIGRQAKMSDLVEIFSEGPDIIPAYVEPQAQFFQDWLAALAR
jgi:hypothetical protein